MRPIAHVSIDHATFGIEALSLPEDQAAALAVWLGDEEDYRPYVGIAGAVEVKVSRRSLVLGGCQPRGQDDALDRWNRMGAYGNSNGLPDASNNYGLGNAGKDRPWMRGWRR